MTKSSSNKVTLPLLAGLMTAVTLVAYVIYGLTFQYYDYMVVVDLAVAVICFLGLHFFSKPDFLDLAAVFFVGMGLGIFFFNSYPVWADELNGITMYNSRGGLVPVIALIVLMLAAIILGIISCFRQREVA